MTELEKKNVAWKREGKLEGQEFAYFMLFDK
jgi:hypothetical protein